MAVVSMEYTRGYKAALRMALELTEGVSPKTRLVGKNTRALLALLHANADRLMAGERPEIWLTPKGEPFFKG